MRENPATMFIAVSLAERVTGKVWFCLSRNKRAKWIRRASGLVIDMYDAGFTIPMPEDPDAVWADLAGSR